MEYYINNKLVPKLGVPEILVATQQFTDEDKDKFLGTMKAHKLPKLSHLKTTEKQRIKRFQVTGKKYS